MPGVKCGTCSRFLSPTDGAKCAECNSIYHRQCVALSQSCSISPSWRCLDCKKKKKDSKEAKNSPDVASSRDTSEIDFTVELRGIKEELYTIRKEFREFREELAEIRLLNTRVDNMERRLDILEKCKESVISAENNLEEVVAQFKSDLNDRDQDLLSNDLEIANLPESKGENVTHLVKLVAQKLGVNLEDRDIVSAGRVGGRHLDSTISSGPTEVRSRPIAVRLAYRDLRDSILRGARIRRGANTADLQIPGPTKRFFVNERLTKHNRALFRLARDAGQQNGWKYVWTSRGRILARRSPGDAVCRIRCESDITNVFNASHKD